MHQKSEETTIALTKTPNDCTGLVLKVTLDLIFPKSTFVVHEWNAFTSYWNAGNCTPVFLQKTVQNFEPRNLGVILCRENENTMLLSFLKSMNGAPEVIPYDVWNHRLNGQRSEFDVLSTSNKNRTMNDVRPV